MSLSYLNAKSVFSLLADIVVPLLGFKILTHYGFSETKALACVAIAPGIKVVLDWMRLRVIDLVGCFVLAEIAMAILLALLFHNARLMLLKGPFQEVVMGVACIASLLARRPLAGTLAGWIARSGVHIGGRSANFSATTDPVRSRHVTVVWAVVLFADAAMRVLMLFSMRVDAYLLISRLTHTALIVSCGIWTLSTLKERP